MRQQRTYLTLQQRTLQQRGLHSNNGSASQAGFSGLSHCAGGCSGGCVVGGCGGCVIGGRGGRLKLSRRSRSSRRSSRCSNRSCRTSKRSGSCVAPFNASDSKIEATYIIILSSKKKRNRNLPRITESANTNANLYLRRAAR